MDTPRYRIGNDLTVIWSITNRDGSPYLLTDKDVSLFVTHQRGQEKILPVIDAESGNILIWEFRGDSQRVLGRYTLTVEIYSENNRCIKRDKCEAFELVGRDCQESMEEGDAVISDGGVLTLATQLDVYRIQPIVPKIVTGEDGNQYWEINGVNTGQRASGKSAYDMAVEYGFEGTREEFGMYQASVAGTLSEVEYLMNRLVVMSEAEYESLEVKDDDVFYFTYEDV